MHQPPPCRTQFVVQRHPDQVVRELVSSVGRLLDDVSGQRLIQRVEQSVIAALPVGGLHQNVMGKVAADDGSDRKHLVARRRQQIEPPPDDLPDPLGNADRRRQCRQRRGAVGAKHTLLLQEPHDLAQEERISLGLGVEAGGQPCRRLRPARGGDEVVHLLGTQSGEVDARHVRRPRQPTQGIGQRMLTRQFGGPVGADQQQPAAGKLGRKELEQAQRRCIGPVQVVQHQQCRLAAAQARRRTAGSSSNMRKRAWAASSRRTEGSRSGIRARISGTMSAMSIAPVPTSASNASEQAVRSAPRMICTHGQ